MSNKYQVSIYANQSQMRLQSRISYPSIANSPLAINGCKIYILIIPEGKVLQYDIMQPRKPLSILYLPSLPSSHLRYNGISITDKFLSVSRSQIDGTQVLNFSASGKLETQFFIPSQSIPYLHENTIWSKFNNTYKIYTIDGILKSEIVFNSITSHYHTFDIGSKFLVRSTFFNRFPTDYATYIYSTKGEIIQEVQVKGTVAFGESEKLLYICPSKGKRENETFIYQLDE